MSDDNKSGSAQEVEFDSLDDILGTSSLTVLAPDSGKNSILSNGETDLTFLDNDDSDDDSDDDTDDSNDDGKAKPPVSKAKIDSILDSDLDDDDSDDNSDAASAPKGPGRHKIAKDGLIEATKKLVERGVLIEFEGDKPIDEYTMNDFEELIEENIKAKIAKVSEEAPLAIFSQLPEEVQAVVGYALDGGTDIKNVFKTLSQTQEVLELDVNNETDQERIVREWLRITKYGTEEEIEDEINSLADRNELSKKANMFKPKLDAEQASVVQKKLEDQAAAKERATKAAANYKKTIYETLLPGELNGIKLDNNTQNMLFNGLTDTTQYQDKNGNATTKLGHLLETYQFGETPNHGLIAEALWLLSDPEAYKKNLKNVGKKDATVDTYRKLKTAEGNRTTASSSSQERKDNTGRTAPTGNLQRPKRNIFSRD